MTQGKMRAIRVREYGGPEVLVVETVDRPKPEAGQVLVRLKAAGVNPVDWKYRSGMLKAFMPITLPWTPGIDGAGVVEEEGPGVTGVRAGDEVLGVFSGSYAEYALAAESDLQRKPANLSFEQAAAVPVGALTAWKAIVEDAAVTPGQNVVVLGAAGGVGLFAVQLARWKGARVTGTASGANVDFVRSVGAHDVVDYRSVPFEETIHDAEVVFDTVGGDTLAKAFRILKKGGLLLSVAGQISDEEARSHGVRALRSGRAPTDRLRLIVDLLEKGTVRSFVGETFSLADAARAHRLVESRHGRGRVVLRIPG